MLREYAALAGFNATRGLCLFRTNPSEGSRGEEEGVSGAKEWASRVGPPKGGSKGGRPKISRFFSLSRRNFLSFFLWGSSR